MIIYNKMSSKDAKTEKITAELIESDSRFVGYYIVVDFKEKDISRIARLELGLKPKDRNFSYPVIVSDLFRGDVAVYHKGRLLFLIERKTWADLASSFRDGRINNMQKMLEARNQTGCKIFYMIEGRKPKPNGRINVRAMQSHLDHCVFRDDVHVIYTDSIAGTVSRIDSMVRNYSTIKFDKHVGASFSTGAGDGAGTGATMQESEPGAKKEEDSSNPDAKKVDHLELLQKKEKKSDSEILRSLYTAIPGISEKTYDMFVKNRISFKRLVQGKVSIDRIAGLKYESGTSVGETRAKKIAGPFVKPGVKHAKIYLKVLGEIPGIGKKTAEVILEAIQFQDLVRIKDPDEISKIKTGSRTIGDSKAKNLIKYIRLSFCENEK